MPQEEARKKLARGEKLTQDETSSLVDQYMIDSFTSRHCRHVVRFDGGDIYCLRPLPCKDHSQSAQKEG